MSDDEPRRTSIRSAMVSATHTPTGTAMSIISHRTNRREKKASTAEFYPIPVTPDTWFTRAVAVTIYGVCAVTFMMVIYALEHRGRIYVLGFAAGCVLSSVYGFLSGAWPFGVVELIWAGVALRRYRADPETAISP